MDTRTDRFAPLRLKAAPATARDPMIRVGVISAVPGVIRSLGADPAGVLAEAGFDISLLNNPNDQITFSGRSRLIARCAEITGCPHFGLLVGQQGGLHSLGLVGLLVRHSPDVGTALHSLVRFFHHHLRGAATDVVIEGQLALLNYTIYQPGTVGTGHIGAGAMAGAVNIMRGLRGAQWTPNEVMLAHRRPANIEPYRQFFRAPILFDAEQNAITFPAALLGQRVAGSEPELHRMLTERMQAFEAQFHDEFPDRVRRVLRTALLTDRTNSADIAALFSMTSRTMNRRLSTYGLSFQVLVDEGRYEIARQALIDTDMNVSHVAALLDYDASSFARAFQRWSGKSPSQWQSEQQTREKLADGGKNDRA
jgi:AraC-like DNA-binding protein